MIRVEVIWQNVGLQNSYPVSSGYHLVSTLQWRHTTFPFAPTVGFFLSVMHFVADWFYF